MKIPKLSILLFNYNQSHYLHDSLEAVLSQTRPADEILITDDASTDDSVSILKAYQSKYPQLQLILNDKNLGMHANVNRAVSLSKTDFVTAFAADDLLLPTCIEKHFEIIRQMPDIGLSCADLTIFQDSKPYRFESYPYLPGSQIRIFSPQQLAETLRQTRFWIASCGCFYNRKWFLKYGGFDPSVKSLCDYQINYQIGLRHGIGYIPEPLASVRIVPNSYGNAVRKDFKQRYNVMDKLFANNIRTKDVAFKEAFTKSRIISYTGLFGLCYLLTNPSKWAYLPGMLVKTWRSAFKKILFKILGKKISPFSFPPAKIFSSYLELKEFTLSLRNGSSSIFVSKS